MEKELFEKYDISYDKMYFRGDKEPIRKRAKALSTACGFSFFLGITITSFIPFFFEVNVAFIVWGIFIAFALIMGLLSDRIKRRDVELDFTYVVGLILKDKETNEEHQGYVFADGARYLSYGVEETRRANTTDGFKLPYVAKIEKNRIKTQIAKKKEANGREFRRMVEDEDFQDKMVKAILANEGVYKEIRLYFFDSFSRGKTRYPGRYYILSAQGKDERKVLIATDCGFDSDVDQSKSVNEG